MRRTALWLMFIGGVVAANAGAVLTLDNGAPTPDGQRFEWVYTLTATDGLIINDFSTITIQGVAGVSSGDAFAFHGWSGGVNPPSGGVSDVVFTNSFSAPGDPSPCITTCDGFTIVSNYGTGAQLNYVVDLAVDPTVLGPAPASAPEPASWAMMLIGVAALGLVAFRRAEK